MRELQNAIERALVLHPGEGLDSLDLAPESGIPVARTDASGGDLNLRDALGRRERELLQEANRRSHGVRKEAARLLGIDPRNLAYYLRKHGLESDAAEDQGGPPR